MPYIGDRSLNYARGSAVGNALEGAQENQDVLLFTGRQGVEQTDHDIRFGTIARMCLDRGQQVAGSTIMQEEGALPGPPERCGAELPTVGRTLRNLVLEPGAHVMQSDVAERGIGHKALIA